MGRKDKQKKKVKGSEKNAIKANKKLASEQKKMMTKLGEIDIIDSVTRLEEEQARLKQVTVSLCEPPTPRSSFSIVAHPEKEEIIIFGGEFFNGQSTQVYNDLYFYNIPKKEWKRVSSPSGPTPRSGHQMVSVFIDGGQLWLFGGEYASPSQSQFYHYKDLWMMSLKEMTWSKVTSPNGPSARSGHRMVYAKKRLIIFGGFYDNYSACHYYNDVHFFSIESYQWEQIRIVGNIQPPPRSGCCIANTSDGKIVIWGGYSKTRLKKNADCGVTHADMYCLTQDATDQCKYEWKKVKPKGYKPLPRSSVGFSPVINGVVYCFGGVMDVEEDDECLAGLFGDELYTLDVQNFSYHTVNFKSNQTKVHSKNVVETTAEYSSSNKISTDGNFTVTLAEKSDTSRRKLNENDTASASAPSARMKPGLCVCKNVLYLYGGLHEEGDKQNTLSDFYALNLSKLKEWEVLIPQKTGNHEWINSDDSDSDSNSSSSETSSSESDMDTD